MKNAGVDHYFAALKGKKIAFLGAGVTNNDCIRWFCRKGMDVTLCDRKSPEQLGELYREFEGLGVSFCLGEQAMEHLEQFDVLFRAPGVYYHKPELERSREKGIVVTSEMETFFDLCPCPTIAVTGSDGKTTTTTLISEMLREMGCRVHLGGNIGRALLPVVEEIQPEDFAVVELSSFQLISMRESPDIAVVTNVAPNHLDVHGTMEEYIVAKENILLHQNAYSHTILNRDNEITWGMRGLVRGELRAFSRRQRVERGAYLREDGVLIAVDKVGEHPLFHQDEIRIPGVHNVENMLTVIAAVWGLVSPEAITRVAREFAGVEHRIELVRERNGVKWYNDSIASSPTRTIAGLNSFSQKVILIAGGYDKKIPYEPLAPKIAEKVKTLILMGATAPKILAALQSCPNYRPEEITILQAENMEQAVALADQAAKQGDIVTLSPASASFDLYPNFEVRGRHFKQLVQSL